MEKNRKGQVNLIIGIEMVAMIDKMAAEDDVSRSAFIRRISRQEWNRRQAEKAAPVKEVAE